MMDYPSHNSARSPANYSTYASTSGFNSYDHNNSFNRDQRYMDTYGRSIGNPLPAMFRAAAVTASSPSATSRVQPFSFYSTTSNNIYDTPRNYPAPINSGYTSDSNGPRRSTVSTRSNQHQSSSYKPAPQQNNRLTVSNESNYFSDSECVTSGPRYYKISRQTNNQRRPSKVALPIRSITSKAYDPYAEPEMPTIPQQAARFVPPPPLFLPSQDQRRKSDPTIDRELGAELLKSPIANKKCYADSSFFKTPFNTYPTIEEQKQMARKIAAILEGGDPTQKGASKFEKQRQRAEKYTLETDSDVPTLNISKYRPLRPLQVNDSMQSNHNQSDVPDCIKNSLKEAQHVNPLRYVGAPEEFKQVHMQEHVTHTNFPPQTAMRLVDDLNNNRGKGAAIFQKRKARSEKWVVDENNVKKSNFQPTSSYIGPTAKPWGQRAPTSLSADEASYSEPNYSPVRPKFNLTTAPISEPPISSLPPVQNAPRFGDFNAKPKGFGSWNTENVTSQSRRGSTDSKKALNLNIGLNIREGILDSYGRPSSSSHPWSPAMTSQANESFNYPPENMLSKWKNQDYSPWNQQRQQEQYPSQMAMTREGVDNIRQRLMQQNPSQLEQQYKQHGVYNQRAVNNSYSLSQGSTQKHFTDL